MLVVCARLRCSAVAVELNQWRCLTDVVQLADTYFRYCRCYQWTVDADSMFCPAGYAAVPVIVYTNYCSTRRKKQRANLGRAAGGCISCQGDPERP